MPFDGALSATNGALADRVDLIAAEAHEAGLGQAAVILAQMAGLLRAMGGEAGPSVVIPETFFEQTYLAT